MPEIASATLDIAPAAITPGQPTPSIVQIPAALSPTNPTQSRAPRFPAPIKSWREQIFALTIGLVGLGVVAFLDQITGTHIHLGSIYIFPVIISAWLGGRWPAYIVCTGCIIAWLYLIEPNIDPNVSKGIFLTNLLIRALYYPVIIELVYRLRNMGSRLQGLVEQQTAALRDEISVRLNAETSLRKLAGQLSAAEDAERRRIAYDIHDALSQTLGLVKLNLETALAESPLETRQHDRLADLVGLVTDLIRQTRHLQFDLHPSMLDDLGLVSTMKQFAQEFQRHTHAQISINELGDRKPISTPLASYLFRATKELINNAVKHGNAAEIIVAVHWLPNGIRIVVDDDGTGFQNPPEPAAGTRPGLGLAGIHERMTSLGGQLRVESQHLQGARIILEVPQFLE